MKTRYVAEWCKSDGPQGNDSFDPDLCEYETAQSPSRERAEEIAQKGAALGPSDDWWRVTEQEYDPNYYERGAGDWEDMRWWVCGEQVHNW